MVCEPHVAEGSYVSAQHKLVNNFKCHEIFKVLIAWDLVNIQLCCQKTIEA